MLLVGLGVGLMLLLPAEPGETLDEPVSNGLDEEPTRSRIGAGRPLGTAPPSARPPTAEVPPPDPGLMGAAQVIEEAGYGHDRRCIVQSDAIVDLSPLSQLLPPRRTAPDVVRIIRREPTGHLVIPTAAGPVELAWTEHECTIDQPRSGTVRGRVTTLEGRPVTGAEVSVCGSSTLTDADGSYEVEAVVDGSAPLESDRAWCTLRAHHPDHGSSTTTTVDLLDDPVALVALEHAPTEADALQDQQQILQDQQQAIRSGEMDPAFETAAAEADLLAELALREGLDAATARALDQAAKARIDAAGDNRATLEALSRGPGP